MGPYTRVDHRGATDSINRGKLYICSSPSPTPIHEGSALTENIVHYCAHCGYKSQSRWNLKQHQSRKHKTPNEDVVEHPLPIQIDEQPMDLDRMKDSIQAFKILKLLQRMKNK